MRRVVLDASAVVAFLYREQGGDAVEALLLDEACEVRMSAVNLCEAATVLAADGMGPDEIRENLELFEEHAESFTAAMAMRAGEMSATTKTAGLSLGDRACLTLAEGAGAVAWTADRAWKKVKTNVAIEFIR